MLSLTVYDIAHHIYFQQHLTSIMNRDPPSLTSIKSGVGVTTL